MRPVDAITLAEAASILGCSVSSVRRLILAGRLAHNGGRYEHRLLSRGEVEALAKALYDWRRHLHDNESYWVTGQHAAGLLDVSVARLNQLAARGSLPYETHADGTRLYRRAQLETVGNARQARWR